MAADELHQAVKAEEWSRVSQLLYSTWSKNVLDCFKVHSKEPWERLDDEKKINELLIYPLALALTGDTKCKKVNGEVTLGHLAEITGFKPTNSLISRGQVCGRMFKYGELTYSCKECANDPTCVLCYDCFKNSAHVNHKYKMHPTSGNGYCDCGDPEAFLNDPVCKLHLPSQEEKDNLDKQLPKDLHTRLHSLVLICLKFIVEVLMADVDNNDLFLPTVIDLREIGNDVHQTILFNDETHTYDSVIRALTMSINCDEDQAKKLAAIVDREGRTIVSVGSIESCTMVQDSIRRRTQKDSSRRTQKSGPLLVKVMRSSVVACQSFAVYLLQWLTSQVKCFAPIGTIIGNVLLHECSKDCRNSADFCREKLIPTIDFDTNLISPSCSHKSPCVRFMLMDRKLWKQARISIHQIFMTSLLMDFKHKKNFGRLFIQHFSDIYNDYVDDDHEYKFSIVAMTVQVFTIPTIARHLIKEDNALSIILEYQSNFLKQYVKTSHRGLPVLDFTNNSTPTVLERALIAMSDVSYLLSSVPKPEEWDEDMSEAFLRGATEFMRLIRNFQHMDEVKRQYSEHQATDAEWETAFSSWYRIQEALHDIIRWSVVNEEVHINLLTRCIQEILHQAEKMTEFQEKRRLVKVNDLEAMSIEFDVSKEPISIWQPLWRYCAALFTAPPEIIKNVVCDDDPSHPDFNTPKVTDNAMAAVTDPNKFLIRMLDRFSLVRFATFGFEDMGLSQSLENTPSTPAASFDDLSKITVTLAEEFFQILIYVVMERYQKGVGKVNVEETLKREIIHLLSMGPCPFSHIERFLQGNESYVKLSLDEIVREVGDFRRPGQSTGVFALKPSLRTQYNAFFWHYSRVNISQAEQQQKKDRSSESREIKACPPPLCPSFEPFYQPIIKLLECKLLSQLLRVTFERYAKQSRFSSDGLIHRALFLCGAAINEQLLNEADRKSAQNEQRTVPERFAFIENAEAQNLLENLKKCQQRAEKNGYGDLWWWTKTKYEEALKVWKGEQDDPKNQEKLDEQSDDSENKAVKRARIAKQKREMALERMKKLQQNFRTQHQDFFEEEPNKKRGGQDQPTTSSQSQEEPMEVDGQRSLDYDDEPETGILPPDAGFPVCLGPNRLHAQQKAQRRITCILCQEEEILSFDTGVVCAAYIESTRLFAQTKVEDDINRTEDYLHYAPSDLYYGNHISTCAHTMHFSCYKSLMSVMKANDRQRNRTQAMSPRILDTERNEYNCPLCKRLCNCAMPLLPTLEQLKGVVPFSENRKNPHEEFPDWIQRMRELCTQQVYSASNGDNPVKSHSRKRSHSERSLADIRKDQAKEGNNSTSCVPFAISSLSTSLSSSTENTSVSSRNLSTSTSTTDTLSNSTLRSTDTLTTFLHETLDTIKGFLGKMDAKKMQTNYSAWGTLSPFFSSLRDRHTKLPVGMPPTPQDADGIVDLITIYTTMGYVLRAICAILQAEKKALFGALNTRQLDSINGMVRLCAVSAFTAKPIALRLLMSRLLTPFLIPLSASRPVPSQLYTAKTLNNIVEIRKHLNSFIRANPLRWHQPDHQKQRSEQPESQSSTAPASPGPSTSQSLFEPESSTPPYQSSTESIQNPFVDINIINVDMISMAIELAMLSGWSVVKGGKQFLHNIGKVEEGPPRVPDGSVDEYHCVQLCLLGHIYQAIVCFVDNDQSGIHNSSRSISDDVSRIQLQDQATADSMELNQEHQKSNEEVEECLKKLVELVKPEKSEKIELDRLRENVKRCTVEFLKPIAMFYNALTLVPPPDVLKYASMDEFEALCRYLDMPVGLLQILKGEHVERLFKLWSSYTRLPQALTKVDRPLKPRTLVELPHDYTDLVNMAAQYRCPSVKTDGMCGAVVTMCLVCGDLLCSQSYCCQRNIKGEQVGSCTYHMYYCSGKTGIFLRIRECQVIFLTASKRGCIKSAPYVDQFGETDWGFRRGNPLFLSTELYKRLQRLWLHQEVAEEVINQYEINIRNSALDWNHF
ncbi:unnamed protein product [Bursaphelenchus okinawaensis]|uniref:E3 ubiquitin-protein ligase n=1 Tax=Bursaphelenchus okinawaensis TaxID=465554 RepID=A0A811JU42_9BILA|nr:unnamed protein product [Bursaphelenchus okinawaensis]CAG9083983.1 unnamed protein product [Bursaphelenchus okinawaensis]